MYIYYMQATSCGRITGSSLYVYCIDMFMAPDCITGSPLYVLYYIGMMVHCMPCLWKPHTYTFKLKPGTSCKQLAHCIYVCIQALACMYGPVVFAALQQDTARAGYTLYSIRISKPFRLELLKLIVLLSSYCIGHDPFGWLRWMHARSRHQISLHEFTVWRPYQHAQGGQHCWCLKL